MSSCKLNMSLAFLILLIASMSNINSFSGDEKFLVFGKSNEESHEDERAEEKKIDKNSKFSDGEKFAIITFDDGEKGHIQNAKPILDKYVFPATFFIVCNYVPEGNGNDEDTHMSWSDILLLQSFGYEIGSHTMNHDNLDELSEQQVDHEVVDSKKCLEDNNINNVRAFSYPFNGGFENEAVVSKIAEHYEIARTATDPLTFLDSEEEGKYAIMGWSHDSDRDEYPSDEAMFKRFVDVVESQSEYNTKGKINAIPVLVYHNISDEKRDYTTSVNLFEKEMKYLKDNGFKVISLSDLI